MPGVLDIWNDNFWGLSEMTDAINILPYVPRMCEEQGIFAKEGISTTSVSLEYLNGTVYLVSNKPRGAPGDLVENDRRVGRAVNCLHLPVSGAVYADDVQNLRAFGQTTIAQTVQQRVNDKLAAMKRNILATLEWLRVGAIKGVLLDADGSTEIFNIYTEFGIAEPEKDFDFSSDAKDVRVQCMELIRTIEGEIGGFPMTMVGVLCSDAWFDHLIQHTTVKEAYKNWTAAQQLTQSFAYKTFDFGGCRFINYRGSVSGNAYIPTNTARAFPMGTDGLFKEYYAPANYEETVNTIGLPFYAKSEMMKFGKGRELEVQSNPLMLCHRPQSCIKLTMTTA